MITSIDDGDGAIAFAPDTPLTVVLDVSDHPQRTVTVTGEQLQAAIRAIVDRRGSESVPGVEVAPSQPVPAWHDTPPVEGRYVWSARDVHSGVRRVPPADLDFVRWFNIPGTRWYGPIPEPGDVRK